MFKPNNTERQSTQIVAVTRFVAAANGRLDIAINRVIILYVCFKRLFV